MMNDNGDYDVVVVTPPIAMLLMTMVMIDAWFALVKSAVLLVYDVNDGVVTIPILALVVRLTDGGGVE